MNASKFALISLAVIAVIAAGCSEKSILGPDQDYNVGAKAINEGQPAVESQTLVNTSDPKREYQTLLVTAHRVDVEGGCWYIEQDKSEVYEPAFNEKSVYLKEGMKLKVYGWVDKGMASYCMIAPVFRVMHYTIFPAQDNGTASTSAFKDSPASLSKEKEDIPKKPSAGTDRKPDPSPDPSIVLRGIYNTTEKGCMFIEDEKGVIAELNFMNSVCPNIARGTLIDVRGSYSLLTWSPCQLASLFNVSSFEIVKRESVDDTDKEHDSGGARSAAEDEEENPRWESYRYFSKETSNRNDF